MNATGFLRSSRKWLAKFWSKFWDWFGEVAAFIVGRLLVGLLFLVGIWLSARVFVGWSEDSTRYTNSLFGIAAVLGALSFSWARCIQEEKEKDRLTYAGERFFHAAVLLIMASVLKYATKEAISEDAVERLGWFPAFLFLSITPFVGLLFFYAVVAAHSGLVVLNRMMWERHWRRPEAEQWA